MPKSPVIFITKFYSPKINPNAKGSNAAHINYIATRKGVEINDNNEKEKDIIDKLDSPELHIKYASERPGSHGLFGEEGAIKNIKDIMKEVKNHDGIVWRNILSLREEDAVRLGFTNKEKWENLLKKIMPDIAKTMGIQESNLRWVAAYHVKEGHPHVHFVIWEKNIQRTRGKINNIERKEIKRILIREIFAEERALLYAQKTALRDAACDLIKDDMTKLNKFIKEVNVSYFEIKEFNGESKNLPPHFNVETIKKVTEYINDIKAILPNKGRIAFSYMPNDVKLKVTEMADYILKQPHLLKIVNEYLKITSSIAKYYTNDEIKIKESTEKAYEDLKKRICQVILKSIVDISKEENKLKEEKYEQQNFSNNKSLASSSVRILNAVFRETDRERAKAEAKAEKLKIILAKESENRKNKQSIWEMDRL
ncbi:MAG: relaxase MobL [Caloramator sp.]|nr:relaxase MobL [Caloramator sp.]